MGNEAQCLNYDDIRLTPMKLKGQEMSRAKEDVVSGRQGWGRPLQGSDRRSLIRNRIIFVTEGLASTDCDGERWRDINQYI